MQIIIRAVGKLKAGPERDLVARYVDRTQKSGRALGITGLTIQEVPESRLQRADDRKKDEATRLVDGLPAGALLIALDERGKTPTSPDFAKKVGTYRDDGARALVFLIGGADGHDPTLVRQCQWTIAFGAMTWPHQLVRILLTEQIYRATTLLSGHPYHRA